MDNHRAALGAALSGIDSVRRTPEKIYCGRWAENGRKLSCFTLFAILPPDKEEAVYNALKPILWPDDEGSTDA